MNGWLLLVLCLIGPLLWGWLIHRLFLGLRLERYFPVPVDRPTARAKLEDGWSYQI